MFSCVSTFMQLKINVFYLFLFLIHTRCRLEIESRAKYELEHILNMLRVILAEKQSAPGELSRDFFFRDDFVGPKFYDALLNLFNEFEQLNFIWYQTLESIQKKKDESNKYFKNSYKTFFSNLCIWREYCVFVK